MDAIELQRDGPVARLLINQPDRRNAINRSMWRSIAAIANDIAADASIRALTLESAVPGSFAAGADISEFEANYQSAESTAQVNAEIFDAVEALASCPQPTLALINGACVGGGLSLVLACDIRVCSTLARFAVTPSRLGLSYHPSDTRRLVSAVGRSVASEMLFAGRMWAADRAMHTGLVTSVYAENEFDQQCKELVDAICANSLSANTAIKRTISAVETGLAEGIEQACMEFNALFDSPDFREGSEAFLAKRESRFPSHAADKTS